MWTQKDAKQKESQNRKQEASSLRIAGEHLNHWAQTSDSECPKTKKES